MRGRFISMGERFINGELVVNGPALSDPEDRLPREIPGFYDYAAMCEGSVWDLKHQRLARMSAPGGGRLRVHLTSDIGEKKVFFLDEIIATAFVPNPHGYTHVRYKDGDDLNLHYTNLEWCEK